MVVRYHQPGSVVWCVGYQQLAPLIYLLHLPIVTLGLRVRREADISLGVGGGGRWRKLITDRLLAMFNRNSMNDCKKHKNKQDRDISQR